MISLWYIDTNNLSTNLTSDPTRRHGTATMEQTSATFASSVDGGQSLRVHFIKILICWWSNNGLIVAIDG
jgi:hypothetical protein